MFREGGPRGLRATEQDRLTMAFARQQVRRRRERRWRLGDGAGREGRHRCGHHRPLRGRQVGGDRRLRGRRLLLRRQPAAADDQPARRPLPPRGQRRAPRRDRLRRARRRVLRRAPRRARPARGGGPAAAGALPRGRRGDADRPLQGDPAPPSARARGVDARRDPRRARPARAAARARRRRHGHQRPHQRRAAAADRRGPARAPRTRASSR